MIKKDYSVLALIFFITRTFFNLYNFNNLLNYLIINIIILVSIFIMKKHNIKTNNIFYLSLIFIIYIIVLVITSNFINNNYFKYNNNFVIIITLLVLSYLIGKEKLGVISSLSEILFFIFFISTIIIYIGLFSQINIVNYKHYININNIIINYMPLLLIIVFMYLKSENILTGYIIGSISVLLDNILLVGVLGTKLILTYKYPAISILKSLSFLNFLNHLDKIFSLSYLFEYTITLSLLINIIINIKKKLKT